MLTSIDERPISITLAATAAHYKAPARKPIKKKGRLCQDVPAPHVANESGGDRCELNSEKPVSCVH